MFASPFGAGTLLPRSGVHTAPSGPTGQSLSIGFQGYCSVYDNLYLCSFVFDVFSLLEVHSHEVDVKLASQIVSPRRFPHSKPRTSTQRTMVDQVAATGLTHWRYALSCQSILTDNSGDAQIAWQASMSPRACCSSDSPSSLSILTLPESSCTRHVPH